MSETSVKPAIQDEFCKFSVFEPSMEPDINLRSQFVTIKQ